MNLIFDIGYNMGEFTQTCFQKYPNCKVVAVEANPSLCSPQDNQRLTLLNCLVSNQNDVELDFYVSPYASGVSTASIEFMENSRFTKGSKNLPTNSIKWNNPIKVKTISLDKMVEVYGVPDLIKIDVEGYEYNVLKGLNKKVNHICFEWHEEEYDNLIMIINHLENLGYEDFGVIGWFDEGDIFEKATFSDKGDPYLEYPKNFYKKSELDLEKLINSERRINYGMFFAK